VVSNFIVQALRGEELTLFGRGTQTRSFCYVDDLIEAMLRLMETESGFTGPVNLGNPSEYSMLELAEKILTLTGSRSRIVSRPLPQDDPRQRQPDISLARAKLGWQPRTALEDGLEKTIAYFRELLARNDPAILESATPGFRQPRAADSDRHPPPRPLRDAAAAPSSP
jgi:UDP-glucuronate decarboxylase